MAGRKISRANMARIQQAADHLHALGAKGPAPDTRPIGGKAESLGDQIEAVARAVYALSGAAGMPCVEDVYPESVVIELCDPDTGAETYWRAAYTTADDGSVTLAGRDAWQQVEEQWVPVTGSAAKAGLVLTGDSLGSHATMKALQDRQIEVTVAYYGHKGGKDSHDEYFSPRTDFAAEDFPTPPLLYYHGYSADGKKMKRPVVTGKLLSRRSESHGHVLTYQLKAGNEYADRQWEAAQAGKCAVSPGTVGHLIRKAADGHLDYWPLAEVSAWDYAPTRKQANLHSVGVPALKAVYLDAGLTLPTPLQAAPEAAGDAAASEIDPETVKQILAAQVEAGLRSLRSTT